MGDVVDELKIREDEGKYYVYFNNPFGSCAYQSDAFATLAEADAFRQEQLDSADYSENNTEKMYCYLWHEKTDIDECKFGERWVKEDKE